MGNNRGNVAREMAAAPLATEVIPAIAETVMAAAISDAIIEQKLEEQAETLKPATVPFKLVGFKLNGKAKDYASDDDKTVVSRKVAFAVFGIADSKFTFQCGVTRVTHSSVKDPANPNRVKVVTRVSMPNGGKMTGFKQIIDTDDPREQRALDEMRAETVQAFKAWLKDESNQSAVQHKGAVHADESVDFE